MQDETWREKLKAGGDVFSRTLTWMQNIELAQISQDIVERFYNGRGVLAVLSANDIQSGMGRSDASFKQHPGEANQIGRYLRSRLNHPAR
jgi:hypothetical protein